MKKLPFNSLQIETTNICNLNCLFCKSRKGLNAKTKKGFMKLSQFKSIIDQVRTEIEEVEVLGRGEPFLTPNFDKMIKYLGDNNIRLKTYTNGTILTPAIEDVIKENNKIKLTFSVDGATGKSYNFLRKGGDLKAVFRNMRKLGSLKKQYKLSNLEIVWQYIITGINEHEVKDLPRIANYMGVDRLRLKTLAINRKDPMYNRLITKNPIYRRKKKNGKNIMNCIFIDPGLPTITWRGNVGPCCVLISDEKYMGNIFKDSLFKIWNNRKYVQFRNDCFKKENEICNTRCSIGEQIIYLK